MSELIKQDLDVWLDNVDYKYLNSNDYVPSSFALTFMNFIKLIERDNPNFNKTPPMHLAMLDKVTEKNPFIANLVFRGAAKTTLFMEYLTLYLAVFNVLPGFGKITGMIYVSDTMENGVKSARKNIEYRYENSKFLQNWLPKATFTDAQFEFRNKEGNPFGVKLYGAMTGIRGTKIFGERPQLAVLDDLISDEASKSPTMMAKIRDTIYNGVMPALLTTRRKIIFNGTPFNKNDVLVQAVESGGWAVNVWPVCEKFPCTKEDFRGAWEDRFTYEYLMEQYKVVLSANNVSSFYQEYMLRVSSEEERLVQDSEIRWYARKDLLAKKERFNFYITTDFATSSKQTADNCVISVWAYNNNGDWFWVDGICEKQNMDKTVNDLFTLVTLYKPQQVGIEVSGQQGGFIPWLQQTMLSRNTWFNFASSEKSNEPGIRPKGDKLTRFQLTVPWFKAGKMYFPEEMKATPIMGQFMSEIRLATSSGIKGKDDCLDTISQLNYLKPWKPADSVNVVEDSSERKRWAIEDERDNDSATGSRLDSYIV